MWKIQRVQLCITAKYRICIEGCKRCDCIISCSRQSDCLVVPIDYRSNSPDVIVITMVMIQIC